MPLRTPLITYMKSCLPLKVISHRDLKYGYATRIRSQTQKAVFPFILILFLPIKYERKQGFPLFPELTE